MTIYPNVSSFTKWKWNSMLGFLGDPMTLEHITATLKKREQINLDASRVKIYTTTRIRELGKCIEIV